MTRPPEIVLAETAALTLRQQAFRRGAKGRLDFALPLDVWLDHHYSVSPSEKPRSLAVDGPDRWYGYAQVVKRGVNPRSKRRIVVVNGGSMSTIRRSRR